MQKSKDIITAAVLILLSGFYLLSSLSIKVFDGVGKSAINAGTIPRIWGCCLMVLSVLLLIRGMKNKDTEKEAENIKKQTAVEWIWKKHAVLGTFFLLAVYVAVLGHVGYFLDTVGYLFCQILILTPPGRKRPVLAAVISIVTAVVTYYMFVRFLNVPLPAGILPM